MDTPLETGSEGAAGTFLDFDLSDALKTDLTGWYISVLDIGLAITFVLATLSNLLLLHIFVRRPGLRSSSNQYIINLLFTNIASLWSIVPALFYDSYLYRKHNRERSEVYACVIEGVTAGMCTASICSVMLIAIDQYFAVLEPLRYHSIIRKRATWQIFLISWTVSVLVGLLGVANNFFHSAYSSVYPILFSLIVFLIPFVLICYIYICIYWAAHENSLRTQKNCSSSLFNACSSSELRQSHDSVLKEKGRMNKMHRCKNSPYPKLGQEGKVKYESKPLLVKERKCKHIIPHKGGKVSKPNELYPITSIEDIDVLTEKKSTPATPEKTLETVTDEQIIMKIDSKNNIDTTVASDGETDKNDLAEVKQPMFFVTKNNTNTILKVNNNLKVSPLNRQLISNTIVTSLVPAAPSPPDENKDSAASLPNLASDQNTSSVISLSQVDDRSSLASSIRNNESVVSLSSYNPSLASSVSDMTLSHGYNDPVMSYFMYDELLSAHFCDQKFLSSLNVNKSDLAQGQEPATTSLKGKDRYVRISLGCYNGIENVHVCKEPEIADENTNCDKLSCKNSELVVSQELSCNSEIVGVSSEMVGVSSEMVGVSSEMVDNKVFQDGLDVSSQLNTNDKAANVTERVINNGLTSTVCDKQESLETNRTSHTGCLSGPEQRTIVCQSREISTDIGIVQEKKTPPKGRMYKKNSCADDRRKQFYENERRKSNDSKCSSDDDCHFYRNMEVFHCYKEKTRSIDSVVSRSGVKSFHPSSTRSSLKSTSSTLVNSLKHRFSNASMFRYREESRTAKISFSVIVMALFSWLPFTVLLLLHSPLFNIIDYCHSSSFEFEKFAVLCMSFHFVFSPLLFALRNKKIKREMWRTVRHMFCFCRQQDEEQKRLRNSFYNDYHLNKQRIKALKEKQRLENRMQGMSNAETMTSQHLLSVVPAPRPASVAVDIEQNNNTVDKVDDAQVSSLEEKISFLSRLLAMKQKCCDSTRTWGNKCLKLAASTTSNTQRSSISSNTVSTSTTDFCNEV